MDFYHLLTHYQVASFVLVFCLSLFKFL